MRPWLLALSFFLIAITGRAQDFPRDFTPTLSFRETLHDQVMGDPDSPGDYLIVPKGTLIINAKASLKGFNINEVDYSTPVGLTVGEFEYEGSLSEDVDFTPGQTTQVRIPFEGFDYFGEPVEFGALTVTWDPAKVTYSMRVDDATQDISVAATSDYYPNIEDTIDRDDLIAAFDFGPFSLSLSSLYMVGTAELETDDRVFDDISNILIEGAIDSTDPKVAIVSPPFTPNQMTEINMEQSPDGLYLLSGTSSDTHVIATKSYPGRVNQVQVRLSDVNYQNLTDGTFVDAQVDSNGNWSLPSTPLIQGINYLTVIATDENGNSATASRTFKYTSVANISVTASASGYDPAANLVAGTVSGGFLGTKKITVNVGLTPTPITVTRKAGDALSVVAKPGVGSVFNGWTGKIGNNTVLTSASETLQFNARPNLLLTANFVPNPFTTAIVGRYQGLVTGADAASRGKFNFSLSKTGAFTGTFKVGKLTIPVKGKVLGSGLWSGTVKKAGKIYTVSLNLTLGTNGDRQVTGTLTGPDVDSDFIVDLNSWKSKTNEATAYVGAYNVLLPAAPGNIDFGFPQGTGYGRVTISKVGAVKFVGKLGDGSAVTASTTLVKRTNSAFFPLHIPLNKGTGSVNGIVTHNAADPLTDLTGTLDWTESVTKAAEPQMFSGQIALRGARYVKPAPGTLVMLTPTLGQGTLTLGAPIYSKPLAPAPTALATTAFSVQLSASTNSLGPVDQLTVKQVKLKFNVSTGLFTGTFRDVAMNKVIPFSGATFSKPQGSAGTAGGVFLRGNRAGFVTLAP